ncbi:ABC transporter substrate-binding subunit SaoX [Clostridiaceae bacterium 35-E11]
MKKILAMTLVAILVLTALTGCGASKQQSSEQAATEQQEKFDDYEIKLGYYNCDHMTGAAVGEAAGIYKEMGLNVTITGNGKVPQAMAAGQMDAGYIGIRGMLAAVGQGSPMVIAADNHIGGSMYLVVSNDIEKPEDLIGQPVAIGNPSKSEGWLAGYSQILNLPTDPEKYQLVTMGSDADKYLALSSGQIKGFTCCDPWGSMAEFEGTGKIMATYMEMDDKMGECCVLSLNKKFVEEHPALAKKITLAHTKSLEYIYTHPYHAAEIFAQYYKVPVEVALMTIYKKTVEEGRTLTWKFQRDRFEHARSVYEKFKLMDIIPTYDEAVMENILENCGAKDFDEFIESEVDPIFPVGMDYDTWLEKAKEIDGK